MKMFYGNIPVNSMKIKHYEVSTNDATVQASDLQSGITCYARGKKVIGTGKAFSFASYGLWETNQSDIIPTTINVVHIGCTDYPVKMIAPMNEMIHYDFSITQKIADVIIDGISYPMTILIQNGELFVSCEKTIGLQLFIGKDEYCD